MKRSMSRRRFVGGAAAVAVGAGAVAQTQAGETPSRDGGAVSETRAVITDFGAKGDGRALNTKAIQSAVDACAARGGGTVVIPPGEFLSGTVVLKSRISLCLAPGAVLRGSGNLADYPPAPFRHNELGENRSLLYAIGQNDIRLVGEGTIDLNDQPFMDWNEPVTGPAFPAEVLAQCDRRQRAEATIRARLRPTQPIFFHNCRRLSVEGVLIRNAPCWTISVSTSRDVKVRGITIDNSLRVSNNDGIHFSSCQDVIVSDCVISCGDDCIAVTCASNYDVIAERIVVANCTMVSRSAAVRIGYQRSRVRDVVLSNLVISDSNRGLGIFAGDGGWVENVVASNLTIQTRLIAGAWWGNGEPLMISAADTPTARIEGLGVRNVRARSENGIVLVGCKGNVRAIDLTDWDLALAYGRNRPLMRPIIGLQPAPVRVGPDPQKHIPWLYADEVADVRLRHIRFGRQRGESKAFSMEPVLRQSADVEQTDARAMKSL